LEILAERLKELRLKHKKTQKEVAEYLGMKEQSYQQYEYNRSTLGTALLKRVADYYNVTTDYLLGRTDTPN
jgi:transcriptional regulator with XRE-family HTH domain